MMQSKPQKIGIGNVFEICFFRTILYYIRRDGLLEMESRTAAEKSRI